MKRFLLTASFVAPAVFALFHGCAADDSTATGTGNGNPMTGTGNPSTGAAGSPTSSSSMMGAGGNGPAVTVTSGNGGNGGSAVTSGGGDGGSSVTSGGGGGAGGAAGGAGGAAGGTGGTGGGAGGGTGGKGGAGGATGGAGGGGDITIDGLAGGMKSNFGFTWKDSWFLSPCYQRVTADCFTAPGNGCPNTAAPDFEDRGSNTKETFKLGGTPGQHYLVTFKYNAVAEAKYHSGGTFADPAMVPATPIAGNPGTFNDTATHNNTFYIGCGVGAMPCTGAAATAQNATVSTYNVYRLRVFDTNGTTLVGRYYMNAFPANGGWESHRTFKISYTHQIEVVGGGTIEMQSADSNCRAIANCGDGADVTNGACNAPRQLSDIGGDMAMIPPTFANIPKAQLNTITGANDPQHWFAQFAHFTITAVAPKTP